MSDGYGYYQGADGNPKVVSPQYPLPVIVQDNISEDLGLVINATNMAAGAFVNSNWFDNYNWVRHLLLSAQSDQQYSFFILRRGRDLVADGGETLATNATANPSFLRPHVFSNKPSGYSFSLSIQNTSASPNTFARVRAQVLGL